jgi:phosphoribosylformylglycinamidine synthase
VASFQKHFSLPIAHGEGKYYAPDETIQKLMANDQILFQYCDKNGNVDESANPNGSLHNIAGICNEGRNVFGMMPHPERAADAELRNEDGALLFKSLLNYSLN